MIWINKSISDVFDSQFEYNDEFSQSKQDDIHTNTDLSSFILINISIRGVEEILYLCDEYKVHIANNNINIKDNNDNNRFV